MSALRVVFLVLLLGSASSGPAVGPTGDDAANLGDEAAVTMTLTSFDVNKKTLLLHCEIQNASDHDVWVCDSLNTDRTEPMSYEVYADSNGSTLVVRRRLGVPMENLVLELPRIEGRYVRLVPGERRTESFTFDLPVRPRTLFARVNPGTPVACRLVLQIGYYDVDVLARLRTILELADELNYAIPVLSDIGADRLEVFDQYFRGFLVSGTFGGLTRFNESWPKGSNLLNIPWACPISREESSLEIALDHVHIPCGS
jgi:hypothetical protein